MIFVPPTLHRKLPPRTRTNLFSSIDRTVCDTIVSAFCLIRLRTRVNPTGALSVRRVEAAPLRAELRRAGAELRRDEPDDAALRAASVAGLEKVRLVTSFPGYHACTTCSSVCSACPGMQLQPRSGFVSPLRGGGWHSYDMILRHARRRKRETSRARPRVSPAEADGNTVRNQSETPGFRST